MRPAGAFPSAGVCILAIFTSVFNKISAEKFGSVSLLSNVEFAKSESLNTSSADVVFGGENATRYANAFAEDRLDQFFTELEDELGLSDEGTNQ